MSEAGWVEVEMMGDTLVDGRRWPERLDAEIQKTSETKDKRLGDRSDTVIRFNFDWFLKLKLPFTVCKTR